MSYGFYKVIHVVSIVIFFALYMSATLKSKDKIKREVILTGIALVFILVSGFGLVAKIGIAHGTGWPLWLKFKVGIFLVVGMFGHIALKRFFEHTPKVFWGLVGILIFASYLANFKPF